MNIIPTTSTADGDQIFHSGPDGIQVVVPKNENIARYPQHGYRLVCFRFAESLSQDVPDESGTVSFRPTADCLRAFFAALQELHPNYRVSIATRPNPQPLRNPLEDTLLTAADRQVIIRTGGNGPVVLLAPQEHTRVRRLENGLIEFMPRTSEVVALAHLHNLGGATQVIHVRGKTEDKPESRRRHWATVNQRRVAQRSRRFRRTACR